MADRRDACYRGLLVCLSLVLWLPRLQGPIDLRYDAGVYYILGTSLAEGRGYRLLNEPGEIEAVQYPPLLPVFVGLHQLALRTSDPMVVGHVLRLSFCVLFTLYLLIVFGFARQSLAPALALLVALISALSVQSIFLSDLLFAEIPFALATTLFMIFHRRSERLPGFVGCALMAVVAFLLRTAGIALLAAWVVESLVRRQWKQTAMRGMVAVLPIALWQAYVSRVTSSEEYCHPAYAYQRAPYQYYNVSYLENTLLIDPFTPELGRLSGGDLAGRICRNLVLIPTNLGEAVTAGRGFWHGVVEVTENVTGHAVPLWLVLIPATLVGCLVAAGTCLWLTKREWLLPTYVVASIGLICLTPWPGQFARYLTPFTPFLAIALIRLLTHLRQRSDKHLAKKWQRATRVLFALVLAFVLGTEILTALHAYLLRHTSVPWQSSPEQTSGGRLFYFDRKWVAFDKAAAWLKEHAEPGAVVATTAPHWIYLKTGRQAVLPPMEADPATAQRLLESCPVTYVILDELDFLDVARRYTAPMIQNYPQRWQLVFSAQEGETRIYRRVESLRMEDGG